ncbi:MAG: ATP-binding protein [Ruminococcaceae bacterium]|nr:ATP-binding protein [Oscillospiraceae bacterium]
MDMTKVISNLAAKAAAANPQNEGDYIGDDGLLYCGSCRTPKQMRIKETLAAAIDGGVMNCLCKCEQEKDRAEKEQERTAREKLILELTSPQRKNECFSDDFYKSMNFGADTGKAPKAIETAHYYVDNFERLKADNMGLMFLGNVGTGKTFAACCIANALLDKGYRVWVITASDLTRKAGNFNTSEETFFKIRDVDLLIVDDFGAQSNTEHNLSLLFDVVDKRYKAKKPLVITSNLTADELKSPNNTQLKRIYSRVIEMCSCPISPVVLTGEELRSGIARAKHEAVIL